MSFSEREWFFLGVFLGAVFMALVCMVVMLIARWPL